MRSKRQNLRRTATSVDQLLRQIPGVRGPVVARGKALIADPNYPSAKQIRAVAGVLAAQWQNGRLGAELPGAAEPSPESGAGRMKGCPPGVSAFNVE
jgi:hypothetical protein